MSAKPSRKLRNDLKGRRMSSNTGQGEYVVEWITPCEGRTVRREFRNQEYAVARFQRLVRFFYDDQFFGAEVRLTDERGRVTLREIIQ